MKYRDKIIEYFDKKPEGTVIVANRMYEDGFTRMSQDAFFRSVERLCDDGIIVRIGKGMYIKSSDADKDYNELLLNYFFGENNDSGMFIGYRLYNKYSLTTYKDSRIELYSEVIRNSRCEVGDICVKKPGITLDFENTRVIEALEILQNYHDIENLNKLKFARYAKQFARGYNDAAAIGVINSMKYKKSTIAFMKKILDMYKVENSLQQFLSYASDYKIPSVQRIAR
ncbi:MAG: hypothetical protein Q4F06_03545 [Eubacteriales bacterium]|nr:hypothetical protein [Eubacteriales bacterium]